jgi:hypothetical protein
MYLCISGYIVACNGGIKTAAGAGSELLKHANMVNNKLLENMPLHKGSIFPFSPFENEDKQRVEEKWMFTETKTLASIYGSFVFS